MMMDCPRCGFAQPKDRYCANCGLDVELFLSKPKPLLIRILQNPNLHLSLIGILMILVIGYILYSRSTFVSREVHHMFGTPLSSREAADPDEAAPAAETKAAPQPEPAPAPAAAVESQTATPGTAPEETPAAPLKDAKRVDLTFWEVARDTLNGLTGAAEKVGESNEGRVYLFKDGSKIAEALRAGSRRVSQVRSVGLQPGAQLMVVTPPSTPEPFQFGFALQVTKWENREAQLRWDSQLVLSQPESAAEMASQTPAVKSVVESTLTGASSLNSNGVLMIVLDPNNRRPRDEYLAKAGEGPWRIFSSDDFRNGVTDWVMLIELK